MKHLEVLQQVRTDLFQLYTESKVERNKDAVLQAQLNVMQAMGKIKKILGIPLDKDEKGGRK